jgi:hypothetical protein
MEKLPTTTVTSSDSPRRNSGRGKKDLRMVLFGVLATLATMTLITSTGPFFPLPRPAPKPIKEFIKSGLERCEEVRMMPPDTTHFRDNRTVSDRYEHGTKSILLSNGTIWTGGDDGEEIIYGGSVLLKNGVVHKVGKHEELMSSLKGGKEDYEVVQLDGKWVTPGIVDTHRQVGCGLRD